MQGRVVSNSLVCDTRQPSLVFAARVVRHHSKLIVIFFWFEKNRIKIHLEIRGLRRSFRSWSRLGRWLFTPWRSTCGWQKLSIKVSNVSIFTGFFCLSSWRVVVLSRIATCRTPSVSGTFLLNGERREVSLIHVVQVSSDWTAEDEDHHANDNKDGNDDKEEYENGSGCTGGVGSFTGWSRINTSCSIVVYTR